ncbi:hypothetical protein PATSB16_38060 [Pandoraea thiooxydans]|nr:hypothetical protein PATSB16_38060 [Pandoraea thiooxydans]
MLRAPANGSTRQRGDGGIAWRLWQRLQGCLRGMPSRIAPWRDDRRGQARWAKI